MHDSKRPWMAALEMQYKALKIFRLAKSKKLPPSVSDHIVDRYLARSPAFSWSSEAASAVWMASKSIPADASFGPDLLPDGLSCCWWWLGWPLPIPMRGAPIDSKDIDYRCIHGLLVANNADARTISICDGRLSGYGPMMTGMVELPYGSLSDMLSGDAFDPSTGVITGRHSPRADALMRFVLAASVWLKQRVVSVERGQVQQYDRGRLMRHLGTTNLADVRVIQLRRMESGDRADDGNAQSVEWSCRWVVNGHWRNQYHPSTGEHELKYILPYVKGPDDKPLKVPAHTVYAVNR